jgi:uroporphyrinogen decarboxylase
MESVERLKATYNFQPVDRLFRRDFYIWNEALLRWQGEGMPIKVFLDKTCEDTIEPGEYPDELNELFGYDERADFPVGMLGWCEPAFVPEIEPKVIESTDDYDIVLDEAGRTVRFKKGLRHGFMPTYLKHAVSCDNDWHEDIAPLLDVNTPARWNDMPGVIEEAKSANAAGKMICQRVIGGYMYLRALVGPEGICYMFMDNPALVHKMMRQWLELADAVTTRVQQHVEIDELFLAEDISYNHGLLVSPDMIREFLFPYYSQLIANIRSRQKDKRLFIQIDTDGFVGDTIDLYLEVGMDVMSPFEIAAGNDVVQIAKKYPNLVMCGGIDKRILADGKEAIDDYLQRVIPFMVKRGGYIPTCDHGVPDNVSYENYMYYRKRIMQLDS